MKYCKKQVVTLLHEYLDFCFKNKLMSDKTKLINGFYYLTDWITDLCNDSYVTETGIEPNKVKEWIEKQKKKKLKNN
jgi:hypothetical protein